MHQGLMLNKNLYMNKFSFKNKLNSFIKFKFKAKDFLKNNLKITLYRKNEKMSKTSSGSISPTKIINIHGSDAMRFYELYIGNFERTKN
ncbi:hypothetical protein E5P55_01030 [Candidatus Pinguicoccus supinus]|uniref:Uncharacterized protein n=1 Tax=Candidatus Pinguicoccus supinus TaxID=2529394 RepID=A0A7T0BRW2_9BACT|nr:hypothetical protein E5P55_01030 [Candidatus Pinguicoccus supinus]